MNRDFKKKEKEKKTFILFIRIYVIVDPFFCKKESNYNKITMFSLFLSFPISLIYIESSFFFLRKKETFKYKRESRTRGEIKKTFVIF
jgi:hypothetical protein